MSASSGRPSTTCTKKADRSRLIFDEHSRIADWCEERIPHFSGWGSEPRAVGYEIEGELKGGVVYTNFSPGNVVASVAMDVPFTRKFLYAIFYNPFIAWKVRHMTCMIEESNVKSLKLCTHLGFVERGRLPESAVDGEDVIILGMLKRECRYLRRP
jgi:hypothetical protein